MEKKEMFDELKWLPKKDAMRYLSVCQRTIENWSNQGLIEPHLLGGRVYFDRFELDNAIRNSSPKKSNQ